MAFSWKKFHQKSLLRLLNFVVLRCWNFDFGRGKGIDFLRPVCLNTNNVNCLGHNRSGEFYSHPFIQEISLGKLIPCLKTYSLYSCLFWKK